MEACQPVWAGDQPDITRSQIEILVPDKTDVCDTFPSVGLRNHHGRKHNWWRKHYGRQIQPHLPIWLNHTPSH